MRKQMRSFDTYTHINELKKAGFNEEQAAVIIKSLVDSRDNDISHLATKEQVNKLDNKLNVSISKLDAKIDTCISKLETKIAETHASTLKWMVGTMIAFSGIILAGIKLI